MCGITGVYSQSLRTEQRETAVRAMNEAQKHRGPDGSHLRSIGPVTIGHNHLKIMDLSENSNQPYSFEHLTLVFNGEVYNYLELRRDLERSGYRFTTSSDTEVVIKSYHRWGTTCVQHFVGMWAFAIWDANQNHLFCSRDRFGIKPFVYSYQPAGQTFSFASEIKALKHAPDFQKELNIAQADRGIALGWVGLGVETYYRNVQTLPASHNLIVDGLGVRTTRYWNIDPDYKNSNSLQDNEFVYKSMFQESLGMHLRSQVEVGACLSGGIDSSSIVSSICQKYPERTQKTFHIYYEDHVDERPFARKVLDANPNTDGYFYSPSGQDLVGYFEGASAAADAPVNGSSFVSHYALMGLVAKHGLRVLVDGQGADEYLGGYLHSFYPLFADQLKRFAFGDLASTFTNHAKNQGFGPSQVASVALKTAAVLGGTERIHQLKGRQVLRKVHEHGSPSFNVQLAEFSKNPLDNFLYHLLFATSLPAILHHNDRNSMAHGIESRVPFLDHRLVEFAFSTVNASKISTAGATKSMLRGAMRGIIPDAIATRYDKKGFVTPGEVAWLRGPLAHLVQDAFTELSWLDSQKVAKLRSDYLAGDLRNAKLVWSLASLNYWLKNDF